MTLLADLADKGENPAGSPHACWLEVDRNAHEAIVCWSEDLAFHAEYNGNDWAPLVRDGWLTSAATDAVTERLADILHETTKRALVVEAIEYGGDEPKVTWQVVSDYSDGETYEAWLDRIGWPIIATLINVTDPGTFNSPYLFTASAIEEKMK